MHKLLSKWCCHSTGINLPSLLSFSCNTEFLEDDDGLLDLFEEEEEELLGVFLP